MNALCALDGVGFKKHTGVMSYFNQEYVKTGKIEIEFAKISKSAFQIRTKSDYSDFYIVSKSDVCEQYENAVLFYNRIRRYIESIKA